MSSVSGGSVADLRAANKAVEWVCYPDRWPWINIQAKSNRDGRIACEWNWRNDDARSEISWTTPQPGSAYVLFRNANPVDRWHWARTSHQLCQQDSEARLQNPRFKLKLTHSSQGLRKVIGFEPLWPTSMENWSEKTGSLPPPHSLDRSGSQTVGQSKRRYWIPKPLHMLTKDPVSKLHRWDKAYGEAKVTWPEIHMYRMNHQKNRQTRYDGLTRTSWLPSVDKADGKRKTDLHIENQPLGQSAAPSSWTW